MFRPNLRIKPQSSIEFNQTAETQIEKNADACARIHICTRIGTHALSALQKTISVVRQMKAHCC